MTVIVSLVLPAVLLVAGCEMFEPYHDPTTQALADPMNWHPNFDDDKLSNTGGTSKSDQKAMDKDLQNANNP